MFLLSKILSNFTPKLNKLHLTTTCPELTKLRHTKKFGGACSRTLLAIMDARRNFRRRGGQAQKKAYTVK